jgi:hypothetical protein
MEKKMKKIFLFASILTAFGTVANSAWCPNNTMAVQNEFRLQIKKHMNDIQDEKFPFEFTLGGQTLKVTKLTREYTHHPQENLSKVLTYEIFFNTDGNNPTCEAQFKASKGGGIIMLSVFFEKR